MIQIIPPTALKSRATTNSKHTCMVVSERSGCRRSRCNRFKSKLSCRISSKYVRQLGLSAAAGRSVFVKNPHPGFDSQYRNRCIDGARSKRCQTKPSLCIICVGLPIRHRRTTGRSTLEHLRILDPRACWPT